MQINKFLKKYLGFTLPEVLITVTIIGVISLLTIPSLVTNITNHQYKTGAKKAHTLISESLDSMKVDVDNIYKTYNNDNIKPTNLRNLYAKYFGLKSVYPPEAFNKMYYPLNNTTTNVNENLYNGGGFQARNGMMILIGRIQKPYTTTEKALVISVDVDGTKKGENQLGKDIFSFEIMPNDNILPIGAQSSIEIGTTSFKSKDYCLTDKAGNNLNGIACAYSAVHEAEYMDTLSDRTGSGQKCDGEWNAQNKTCQCANGKQWKNEICVCPEGYIEKGNICYDANDPESALNSNGQNVKCKASDFKELDTETFTCKCINGYDKNGDNCVKNTENTLEDGTFCEHGKIDEETCKCINDKEYVPAQNKCLDKCIVGTIRNNTSGECECNTALDLVLVGGTQCCPAARGRATLITGDTAIGCNYECDASKGLVYDGGNDCKCMNGLHTEENKSCSCTMKFATINSSGACECVASREMKDNECICKNGSTTTDDPNCGCDSTKGLIASGVKDGCECDVSAGYASGSPSGDNSCECDSSRNYQKVDDKCVCKEGYVAGVDGCKCDTGNNWVATTGGGCECPVGNGFTRDGRECRCDGTVKYQGNTQICDGNCKNGAVWNKIKKECECNLIGDYDQLNEEGNSCECQIGEMSVQYINGSYTCQCPTGYRADNNNKTCMKDGGNPCNARGQKWNGTDCECQDGTIRLDDGTCGCPVGFEANSELNTDLGNDYKQTTTHYEKLYCIHSGCNDSLGTWHGEGGNIGKCECDEGLELSYDGTCKCNIDAIAKEKEPKSGINSCICNTEKLTYQKIDDEWQCAPNNEDKIYELGSASDLVNATNLLGSYNYKLSNSIKYEGVWTPWGTIENPFKSNFDGGGKTITVNEINGTDYVGFFGYTQKDCSISNLNLVVNNVNGKSYVGALVGLNNCKIENVTVTINGTVKGEYIIGGFAGSNNAEIKTSKITGTDPDALGKILSGNIAGGFVGENKGIIKLCKVDNLNIKTQNSILGGFVGINHSSIYQSSVGDNVEIGEISTGTIIGGFVGEMTGLAQISNCYNRANSIKGYDEIGGFVGYFDKGTISRVYSTTIPTSSNINASMGTFIGNTNENKDNINISESFVLEGNLANQEYEYGNKISDSIKNKLSNYLSVKTDQDLKIPSTFVCKNWEKDVWYYPLIKQGDETLGEEDEYSYPELLQPSSCDKYNAAGFIINGINKCITCGTYEYFNGTDTCISIYNLDNSCNMCPIDKHYNSATGLCVDCREDQEWNSNTNKCTCAEGFEEKDNKCVCAENGIYYVGWGCINCEETNGTLDSGKCVCSYTNDEGIEIKYDYDPFLMGEKCNRCVEQGQLADENGNCKGCTTNRIPNNDNTACICHATMKENTDTISPDCICKLPEMKYANVDPLISTYCECPGGSNHVYNEAKNKCECINGTVYYPAQKGFDAGDSCVYCPHGVNVDGLCGCLNANEIYDVVEGKCIVDCVSKGLVYDYTTETCTCPEGSTLKEGTLDVCTCEDKNKIFQNGSCISCPPDANPDVVNATCDCGSGKKYDANKNTCVSACPPDSTESGDTCICEDTNLIYNTHQNKCLACPSNANKEENTCICKNPLMLYDEESNTCIEISCPTPADNIIKIITAKDLVVLSLCSNYYDGTTEDKAKWTTEGKTFSLQNDIDMKDYENFKPIYDFKGVFIGNGKKISNLTINVPEEENVGMFGTVIFNGTSLIREVILDNFNIKGKNNVGSLIGKAEYNHTGAAVTGITNITINTEQPSNKIISTGGSSCTGGLIGKITSTTTKAFMIKDIAITHNIDAASAGYKGGLIGCVDVTSGTLRLQNTDTSNVDFINDEGTDAQIGGLIGHRTTTNTPQVSSATKNNICKWDSWLGGGAQITETEGYTTTHINCTNK